MLIDVSLALFNARNFPVLSTLATGQWFARAAQIGDRGYSNFGATVFDSQVDPWDDTGRTYVQIRAIPARGPGDTIGAWGYRLWADGARSPETVGETPSALPIWISEGKRTGLSNFSGALSVWVQPMYCADLANRAVLANWTVAGAAKQVFIPPAASTLAAGDWTVEAYAPDTGVAGFLVSGAALESAVFVYATDAVSPDNFAEHWTALTPIIDSEGAVTGWYGLGTAGATRDMTIIYQTATTKTSAPSDTKSVTLPDTPADFVTGNITLADDASPGGNRLAATLVAIPATGGLSATVEYALDSGAGYGATQSGGAATAGRVFSITTLAETGTIARFRLRTAYGVSGWLSVGPVTPTVDATESFVIDAESTINTGEMLHAQPDPATLASLAAQTPYDVAEFRHRASYRWEFAVGDAGEDYDWTFMPSWALVPARAGTATGPFAAHTYVTTGAKTLRCTIQCYGQVWQATKTVTVSDRSYSSANTGLLDVSLTPDWTDGSPPTHDVGNRFTDPTTAFEWWLAGDGRRLLIRRGTEFDFPPVGKSVTAGSMLGAYGLASAAPKMIVKFDRGTAATDGLRKAWGQSPILDVIATAGQTEFTPASAIPGRIYVYKEGVRQAAGAMSFDATTITLTTPCVGGERITAWEWASTLAIPGAAYERDLKTPIIDAVAAEGQDAFQASYDPRGFYPALGHAIDVEVNGARTLNYTLSSDRTVLTLDTPASAGDTVQVWTHGGLETNGASSTLFEPREAGVLLRDFEIEAEPDFYYDPANPPMFDVENLSTFAHAVSTIVINFGGEAGNQHVFRVSVKGLGLFYTGATGPYSGLADCHATDWYDYGVLTGSENSFYTAMVGCALYQNPGAISGPGGKIKNVPGLPSYADHGPYRSSNDKGRVINRCLLTTWNSWAPAGMAVDNDISQPVIRIFQGTANPPGSWSVTEVHGIGGVQFITSGNASPRKALPNVDCAYAANNIWIGNRKAGSQWIDCGHYFGTQNNLIVLPDLDDWGLSKWSLSAIEDPGEFFVYPSIESRAPLSINDSIIVQKSALTGTLVLTKPHPLQSTGWINLAGPSAGTVPVAGSNTVTVPIGGYTDTGGFNGLLRVWRSTTGNAADATSPLTLTDHEATYSLAPWSRGVQTGDLTITLASGTFGAGERVWVTSEPVPADGVLFTNNRSTPLVMPPLSLENPLIVVNGDWQFFRIVDGGALLDPADYRSSRFGTFDGLWRPQAGHSVPLATGALTQTDLRGDDRTTPLIGAMEQTTDVSDLVASALPSEPSVSLAWGAVSYNDGDSMSAADFTATIDAAGQPALTLGQITKTLLRNGEVVSSSVTVAEGDVMTGEAFYTHPLAGRVTVSLAARTVQAASGPVFTSELVDNVSTAKIVVTNASTPAGPWHFAARFRVESTPGGGAQRILAADGGIDIYYDTTPERIVPRLASTFVGRFGGLDSPGPIAVGDWVSLLCSFHPADDGGPGGTDSLSGHVKVGSAAWAPAVPFSGTNSIAMTTGDLYFFGSATSAADFVLDTQIGLWAGGAPSYTDFFEEDGTPKNWTADTTLGVSGMVAQYLWSGLSSLNDPASGNLGSGTGTITLAGGPFVAV